MKRVVSAILLVMLLTSMLCSVFKIIPVGAAGTIYIRADGSIDPPTANITSGDNVTYTFIDDFYGRIEIERSSIVIDGTGHTIQGTGGNGFHWNGIGGITIKNLNIRGFDIAV